MYLSEIHRETSRVATSSPLLPLQLQAKAWWRLGSPLAAGDKPSHFEYRFRVRWLLRHFVHCPRVHWPLYRRVGRLCSRRHEGGARGLLLLGDPLGLDAESVHKRVDCNRAVGRGGDPEQSHWTQTGHTPADTHASIGSRTTRHTPADAHALVGSSTAATDRQSAESKGRIDAAYGSPRDSRRKASLSLAAGIL